MNMFNILYSNIADVIPMSLDSKDRFGNVTLTANGL